MKVITKTVSISMTPQEAKAFKRAAKAAKLDRSKFWRLVWSQWQASQGNDLDARQPIGFMASRTNTPLLD